MWKINVQKWKYGGDFDEHENKRERQPLFKLIFQNKDNNKYN